MNHTFVAGSLELTTDAGDAVVVTCNAGNTRVNLADLAGPVPCADVESLTVTGDSLSNSIDLSGVTLADFSFPLSTVLVNGGNEVTGVTETIIGSPINDTINGGGNGSETINGLAGDDTLNGQAGNDPITGGPGTDNVNGGEANDDFFWSPGDGSDTLNLGGADDEIFVTGDNGADQFTITADDDGYDIDRVPALGHIEVTTSVASDEISINTGDGIDTITGDAGVAAANVTETFLQGGVGVDTITGTDARDTITGGGDNDILAGSDGDDTAVWAAGDGDDSFSGGGGTDTAQANGDVVGETFEFGPGGSGVLIERTLPSTAQIDADTIERVNISAGDGNDTVTGSAGLAALGVSSTLAGGNDLDVLTGSDANDNLSGNAGDDDELTGGAGDDTFVWNAGDGSDVLHGSAGGTDTADFNGDNTVETLTIAPDLGNPGEIDLDRNPPSADHVDADTIERFNVRGNGQNDIITAGTGFDALGIALTLSGGDATDIITGSDTADTINGGNGGDTVDAGGGDDVLNLDPTSAATDDYDGDAGEDSLFLTPDTGGGNWTMQPEPEPSTKIELKRPNAPAVTVRAGTIEHITQDLGSGNDMLTASGLLAPLGLETTTINGGSGTDTIVGSDVADTLNGGDGDDSVTGGAGSDTLTGGANIDSIFARDGVGDQVDCGSETDTAQTDQPSLDPAVNCETVDALAEPPVSTTPTTPTTTTPTPADDTTCDALRKKLKKAKSKKQRKKLKRKLRQNDC